MYLFIYPKSIHDHKFCRGRIITHTTTKNEWNKSKHNNDFVFIITAKKSYHSDYIPFSATINK